MKLRKILITLALLSFLSTSAGAYLYFNSLKESAYKESYKQALSSMDVVQSRVASALGEKLKFVKALSRLKEVEQVLVRKDEKGVADANRILDFFRDALDVDVCYLLDQEGDAVASTSRRDPNSYLGEDFSDHPYFRQALQGSPAIYMAFSVASAKRDMYFSHPVYPPSRFNPAGVVVIKTSVEPMEREFGKAFGGIVLLTDPNGIIVVSTREGWLYHLLWEKPRENPAKNVKTPSSEQMPWKWSGLERKDDSLARDDSGNEYLMHQEEVEDFPGWHVVLLTNLQSLSRKFSAPLARVTGYVIFILYVLIGFAVLFLYKEASRDIGEKNRAGEALRESERQLRFLSSQLLKAQEEERMRVSKQLRDSVGLSLNAIKYSLEKTLMHMDQESVARESLSAVLDMTEKPLEESRRIMADLRPSMLDDLGLVVTIGWLCKRFREAHPEIVLVHRVEVEEEAISDHLKLVIFRVLEEAFNNIGRHSRAGQVSISLVRDGKDIHLIVRDNGVGFDLKQAISSEDDRRGIGLASMKERVMLSGGAFTLQSERDVGTTIFAQWPLREMEKATS